MKAASSIRRKVTLALFAATALALATVATTLWIFEYRATDLRARATLQSLAETIAPSLVASLDFGAAEVAGETLQRLQTGRIVVAATVYRVTGTDGIPPVFARYVRPGAQPVLSAESTAIEFVRRGDRALLTHTILVDEVPVAILQLEADVGGFRRSLDETLVVLGLVLAVLAVAAIGLSRLLQRALTTPLLELATTVDHVRTRDDFSARAEVRTRDEIGQLAQDFNLMLAGIEQRDRRLAEHAAFQQAVLDNAGVAIISTDAAGIIRTFNDTAERMLGYPRSEVLGCATPIAFHDGEEIAACAAGLSQRLGHTIAPDFAIFAALARESPAQQEWTYLRKDGGRIPIILVISTLRADDGHIVGYCGIATDLTERKAAEDRYRTIIQTTADGFWILDRNGTIVDANDSIGQMLGCFREELLGCNLAKIKAIEEPAELDAHLGRIAAAGVDHFETSLRRRDGSVLSAELSVNHLPGESGGFFVFIRDVTERKAREEALRQSEERFRLVAERTGQLVFDFTPATAKAEWNGHAESIIGYSASFLNRHSPDWWTEQIHPDDRDGSARAWEHLAATGRLDRLMYRFRRSDGTWIHLMANAVTITPRDGHGIRILGTIADVTEQQEAAAAIRRLNTELEQRVRDRTAELDRRVAEVEALNAEQQRLMHDLRGSEEGLARSAARLQEANANLLAANQELESFSYSVSHDLRAPLRNIAGFIELLRRRSAGQLDTEADRYFGIIGSEAIRMGSLIDDLLTFSRIGRAELHLAPVQLAELVAEVRGELHSDLTNREVDWRIQPLPTVLGDRVLLRQVVANLLANAVKFTRHRRPAVIEIGAQTATPDARLLTFFVRDNGAGFDPKYTAKLFGVFQRLHNPREFEGTGIGLANVKRIVSRHGGQVWAEGAIDQGATFYFSLRPSRD